MMRAGLKMCQNCGKMVKKINVQAKITKLMVLQVADTHRCSNSKEPSLQVPQPLTFPPTNDPVTPRKSQKTIEFVNIQAKIIKKGGLTFLTP